MKHLMSEKVQIGQTFRNDLQNVKYLTPKTILSHCYLVYLIHIFQNLWDQQRSKFVKYELIANQTKYDQF